MILHSPPEKPGHARSSLAWTAALAALLMIASCAFHDKMPEGWRASTQVAGDHCPDISGVYESRGENASAVGKTAASPSPERLTAYLILDLRRINEAVHWDIDRVSTASDLDQVDKISVHREGDRRIRLMGWQGGQIALSGYIDRAADGFACEDGWIRIRTTRWPGLAKVDTTISIARDGEYLLVKPEIDNLIIHVIPVWFSQSTWNRYRRLGDAHSVSGK